MNNIVNSRDSHNSRKLNRFQPLCGRISTRRRNLVCSGAKILAASEFAIVATSVVVAVIRTAPFELGRLRSVAGKVLRSGCCRTSWVLQDIPAKKRDTNQRDGR